MNAESDQCPGVGPVRSIGRYKNAKWVVMAIVVAIVVVVGSGGVFLVCIVTAYVIKMSWQIQGSKNVFESGHQFGHVEERLVAKLSLVSKSEIPEVNKSLISLLRPFPRLSCLTLN